MRSFWSLSLQRQLAIAIGLLLVPLLAAAIWSGMTTFHERANELGEQTRLVAFTTAAYVDHDLAYLDGPPSRRQLVDDAPVVLVPSGTRLNRTRNDKGDVPRWRHRTTRTPRAIHGA